MQLTARHLVALLVVCGSLLLAVFLAKDFGAAAGVVGVAGGIAGIVVAASATSGPSLDSLVDAVRRAARGEAVAVPAGASGVTLRIHEELNRFADAVASERAAETR